MTAVIPVKPLGRALGRLGDALPAPARRDLQWEMLGAVLAACTSATGVSEVVVVTGDAAVAGRARAVGARVVDDHDPPRGMNAAVILGCEAADTEAALVLTADLPLARARDLDAVIASAPPAPGAVCVPSRDGTGTNALLLHGPRVLDPQLGPGSLALHEEQARRRGVAMVRCERACLALDIDTPDDLAVLDDLAPGWTAVADMMEYAAVGGVR